MSAVVESLRQRSRSRRASGCHAMLTLMLSLSLAHQLMPVSQSMAFAASNSANSWPAAVVVARRTPFDCPQPCSCPPQQVQCHAGVTAVTDGCGCCQICARQEGEDCDARLVCDPAKDLVCQRDSEPPGIVGFCRKRTGGHSCHVNGNAYRDGQTFNSTCRYRCLCQDGRVACSDVCAHQTHRPPAAVCLHSSLVSIPGRCCKEWICEQAPRSSAGAAAAAADASGGSAAAASGEEVVARKSRHGHAGDRAASSAVTATGCPQQFKVVTKWSACSATCGVGVSSRLNNDNGECQTIRETRLCMIAECVADTGGEEAGCRSTVRADQPMHLTYTEDPPAEGRSPVRCRSVRLWKPKFCNGCQRRRCCRPLKIKTKMVEFQCEDGVGRARQWAWIKRCACTNRGCHRRF